MANEQQGPNDPIETWQSQSTELPTMTLQLVRNWAERVDRKSKEHLRTQLLATTFFVVFAAQWLWRSSSTTERVVLGIAIVWIVAGQIHAIVTGKSKQLPEGPGLQPTMSFIRIALQRRRDHLRLEWARYLGPIFLLIGVISVPRFTNTTQDMKKAAPFFILLGVWAIAYYFKRRSVARDFEREMQELTDLEKESGVRRS